MRGIIALVEPWDPIAQAHVQIRVGKARNSQTLQLGGVPWYSAVTRAPRISMQLLDDNITGKLQQASGDMTIAGNLIRGAPNLPEFVWPGARITILSGDGPALEDMRLEFFGRVTGGVRNRDTGQIPLSFEVDKKMVDVPLLSEEYGGGGGVDGDPEVRGQLKPLGIGTPFNIPPFLFDSTNNVLQVDAYGNTLELENLYENAAPFGPKVGDFPDYDALVAAAIVEGEWGTCVAEGMIRTGAAAKGVITCDPVFDHGRPGAMALRWLELAGVSAENIFAETFDQLTADVEAVLGHDAPVDFWTQDQVNTLDRLQALCASCNAVPIIGLDGKIAVTRAFGGAQVLELRRRGNVPPVTGWRSLDPTTPWWRLKMSAAKTYRIHTEAEIDYADEIDFIGDYDVAEEYRQGQVVKDPATQILYLYTAEEPGTGFALDDPTHWAVYEDAPDATVVKYADGTPVEALKPAEAGADPTGSHTATGILGQGALATKSLVDWLTDLTGAPDWTTDGRIDDGLNPDGTINQPIPVGIANLSNLLRFLTGGIFTGELDADQTSDHTALGILSQGALATLSALLLGSGYLQSSSGSTLTDLLVLTTLGTSAGFSGQGALATLSALLLGSAFLKSSTGVTLTDLLVLTTLGTAAGFTGQGALATLSTLLLGPSGRLYEEDGTTRLTNLLILTALGSAASFAGQGALATLSSLLLGGGRLFAADGTTALTNLLVLTTLGTAAAFAGQGALATLSSLLLGGGRLFAADGTTALTNLTVLTALGTAAAFSGQGALATLSALAFGSAQLTGFGALAGLASLALSGGRLFAADGSTQLTNATVLTTLGTAAGFTGQGALATLSSLAYGTAQLTGFGTLAALAFATLSTNVRRADGTTIVTDAMAITSIGTAASFTGQGALATLSSLAYGGAQLTGFGSLAALAFVSLSTNVRRADGTTVLTDAMAVTAIGVSSGIAGQGSLATLSAATWQTQVVGTGKPSDFAGTTVTFAVRGGAPVITGNYAQFTSAGSGVYVTDPSSGPAQIRFRRAGGPNVGFFTAGVGGTSPFYVVTHSNQLRVFSTAGGQISNAANFPQSSWCQIAYDNLQFKVAIDGTVVFTTGAVSGLILYAVAYQGLDNSDAVIDFMWGPYTDNNWSSIGGTGRPQDGADVTLTHTSASFTGQGALATLSALLLGSGRLLASNGSTSLTDASVITNQGTASGIAGQGALATLSSLAYGSGNLTGFGSLAALTFVTLSSTVRRADGTTIVTDAMVVTAIGQASSIAGQGSLATLSAADYATQVTGTGKPEVGAARNQVYIYTQSQFQPATPAGNGVPAGWRLTPLLPWTPALANVAQTNGNTSYVKNAGGGGAWDASVRSLEAFASAKLTWRFSQTNAEIMVALNSDPAANNSYDTLDFAAYARSDGQLVIYQNGTGYNGAAPVSTYLTTDDFCLSVNPAGYMILTKNGVPLGPAVFVGVGASFYFDTSFATVGGAINSVSFQPDDPRPLWESIGEQDGADVLYGVWSTPAAYGNPETRAKTQALGPDGRVTSTGAALNSNNNFGLRALSTTPGMSATLDGGGTTATVNFDTAGNLLSDSGQSIALPSASFPGLALSTQYFFYRNMATPTVAGSAAGSYGYSTNLSDALGTTKVYLGYYTTPAAGGGGGGGGGYGGGGGCVDPESWIPVRHKGLKHAGDVLAGDEIMVLTSDLQAWTWTPVVENGIASNWMVTITTESGIRLRLAINTPMPQPDGRTYEKAGNCTGLMAAVLAMGVFRWEKIIDVAAEKDEAPCSLIRCENGTYAAGVGIGNYVFSHNIQYNAKL